MRSIFALAAVTFVAGGAGGGYWYINHGSPDAKFLAACEDALSSRLRSPSTYDRVSVIINPRRPASLDEYMETTTEEQKKRAKLTESRNKDLAKTAKLRKDIFEAGTFDLVSLVLIYDAANAYGTPIRGEANCWDTVQAGKPAKAGIFGPKIDGYTNVDWSLKQLYEM